MPEDDQPPEHLWLDSEAIEGHFAYIRAKYTNGNASSDMQAVPDPSEWDQNELTKQWR